MRRVRLDTSDRFTAGTDRVIVAGAVISLAVAWAAVNVLRIGSVHDTEIVRRFVLVAASISGAGVGHLINRTAPLSLVRGITSVVLPTLGAGAVLGGSIALLNREPCSRTTVVALGLVVAAVALPGMLLLLGAARRLSRARVGSEVALLHERAIVAYAAVTIGVIALASMPPWFSEHRSLPRLASDGPTVLAWISTASLFGVLGFDVAALIKLRHLKAVVLEMDPAAPPRSGDAPDLVDIGIGDAYYAGTATWPTPYRAAPQPSFFLRGEPARGCNIALKAIARDVAGLSVVFAAYAVFAGTPATIADDFVYDADAARGAEPVHGKPHGAARNEHGLALDSWGPGGLVTLKTTDGFRNLELVAATKDGAFRDCYGVRREGPPFASAMEGTATFTVTLGANGRVGAVSTTRVRGDLPTEAVECASGAIASMHFPPGALGAMRFDVVVAFAPA